MSESQKKVHEAISAMLDDGEIAISWVLTVDVAGADDTRYLAHRAGGGADGEDFPMAWTALGMLRSSMKVAERQLAESTGDVEDGDDE